MADVSKVLNSNNISKNNVLLIKKPFLTFFFLQSFNII